MPTGRPLVITGATGFLGRHLLAAAAPTWPGPVRAITRRETSGLPSVVTQMHGDLDDASFLERAIPEGSAVVHLAYDPERGADRNLMLATRVGEACARVGVERLVQVSTAAVVGRCADRLVTEMTVPRPITEYQRTKLEIESILTRLARGRFPLVTLRPTAVFGAGGASLVKLTKDLLSGPTWVNYLRSCASGRRAMNLVPVETVIAGVEFALRSPRAVEDGLYFISEDDAPENNFRDIERILQRALGRKDYLLPRVPVPRAWLTVALRASGRFSLDPATCFSSARLSRAGFVPPITFHDALERYARQARDEGRPR